jgi:hypothetical protein
MYALRRDRAFSLRLSSGSVVRASSGVVWLTQEGLIEDVVLKTGDRFTTTGSGLVVMNAVEGSASVFVELPAKATRTEPMITPELVAAIEAKARRLRQEELARLLNVARLWIVRIGRALKARIMAA